MTQSFTYDGDPLLRVRTSTVSLTESAELGAVGNGRLTVNDKAGTKAILGQKDFAVDQDDCANPVLYRGFVGDQEYKRGAEAQGPSREIEVVVEDLNAMLGFLVFSGDSTEEGDRPAETCDDRLEWLVDWLATNMPGLFVGTRIGSSDHGLDATNFADQHPSDVLAGIILAAGGGGWNYYVRDFGTGNGPELVCRDDNTSTDDTSSLVISNVIADIDFETTFPPFKDFVLSKRPGRVGSKVRFSYSKDVVEDERAATATAFNGWRDLTATDSSVKDAATAHERAKALLWQHRNEERVIEGTILLPPEAVNLACQGDRIGVRLEHLTPEGFYDVDDLVYCRILERTTRPLLKPTRFYEVRLKLSPQEAAPPATGFVQMAFGRGFAGGLSLGLANPVTIGGKLVILIATKLDDDPETPSHVVDQLHIGGTGAWTRFNGATKTSAYPGTYGMSAWYKTATATDHIAYISEQNPAVAIFELEATADPASATIVDQDETVGGPNYDIGTQTPAAGEVAIAGWVMGPLPAPATFEWAGAPANGPLMPYQTPNPDPNISAGWTLDYSRWVSDGTFLGYWQPASPWTVFAHAEGAGSALLARVTPGESGHPFGALYLVIPPL